MSYEGYMQRLCKNGHSWDTDALAEMYREDGEENPNFCSVCNYPAIWENRVDQTNEEIPPGCVGGPIPLVRIGLDTYRLPTEEEAEKLCLAEIERCRDAESKEEMLRLLRGYPKQNWARALELLE